jgi:hypothetical protein
MIFTKFLLSLPTVNLALLVVLFALFVVLKGDVRGMCEDPLLQEVDCCCEYLLLRP